MQNTIPDPSPEVAAMFPDLVEMCRLSRELSAMTPTWHFIRHARKYKEFKQAQERWQRAYDARFGTHT